MQQFTEQHQQPDTRTHSLALDPRLQIKQELRQRIQSALQFAKTLAPDSCLNEIKTRLQAIQSYCETVQKTFIVVEQQITCEQYDLGGTCQDTAILFRGPSEDASVAICVTGKGSLLHRNGCTWQIYKNAGDVNPEQHFRLV
jgi:hypothetical protein